MILRVLDIDSQLKDENKRPEKDLTNIDIMRRLRSSCRFFIKILIPSANIVYSLDCIYTSNNKFSPLRKENEILRFRVVLQHMTYL